MREDKNMCCRCRFWKEGESQEVEDTPETNRVSYRYLSPVCFRYPRHIRVDPDHFCGEFKQQSLEIKSGD